VAGDGGRAAAVEAGQPAREPRLGVGYITTECCRPAVWSSIILPKRVAPICPKLYVADEPMPCTAPNALGREDGCFEVLRLFLVASSNKKYSLFT
jgi:hypothetical protein